MSMSSLTVTGWPTNGKAGPVIVSTRSGLADDKLLNFELENRPPSNATGNLVLKLFSSVLTNGAAKIAKAFAQGILKGEVSLYH
jgi:hypothetical protein